MGATRVKLVFLLGWHNDGNFERMSTFFTSAQVPKQKGKAKKKKKRFWCKLSGRKGF